MPSHKAAYRRMHRTRTEERAWREVFANADKDGTVMQRAIAKALKEKKA